MPPRSLDKERLGQGRDLREMKVTSEKKYLIFSSCLTVPQTFSVIKTDRLIPYKKIIGVCSKNPQIKIAVEGSDFLKLRTQNRLRIVRNVKECCVSRKEIRTSTQCVAANHKTHQYKK
jgi:hypothetical protein